MDAIEFVNHYQQFLSEIEKVVKPEYKKAIKTLREKDPHDIVRPEAWFHNINDARGLVWALFLRESKEK